MRFSWDLRAADTGWAVFLVLDALASLPLLQDLHLRCWSVPAPSWQLQRLPHIVNFSFTCDWELDYDCSTIMPVARFLDWNQPRLKTLSIVNRRFYAHTNIQLSLDDFLSEIPDSAFLNITHLSLSGLFVKLDATLILHLRSLISLHIENIFSTGDLVSGNPGSSTGNIWSSLRLENIHLQEIVTDDVQLTFIEYLTSFSGLRRLRLTRASRYTMTPLESDQLAITFYGRALQNHVHSLESLEIDARYEGKWCFADHCSSIIKQCACLTSLKLSIHSKDVREEKEEDEDGDEDGDDVVAVVDDGDDDSDDDSDDDEEDSPPGGGNCNAVVCFHFMTSRTLLNLLVVTFGHLRTSTCFKNSWIIQRFSRIHSRGQVWDIRCYAPCLDK